MEALEKQQEHDNKCSDAFQIILPSDYISAYDNSYIQKQLIKLMQVAMKDEGRDSWIDYFIWELEFGKKYKFGCATNADGSNIDLSSAGALYDFLNLQ